MPSCALEGRWRQPADFWNGHYPAGAYLVPVRLGVRVPVGRDELVQHDQPGRLDSLPELLAARQHLHSPGTQSQHTSPYKNTHARVLI